MITNLLLGEIHLHAYQQSPRECCGLIVATKRKTIYYPCTNIATTNEHFFISPEDYADAEDLGEVLAIVHSHVNIPPTPSHADLVGIEKSGLPWIIVNHPVGTHTINYPTGYVAPLVGRAFAHGVLDCYSIIRDYYAQELNVLLPDFKRGADWWLKNQNLYRDGFAEAGFHEVSRDELREHDVLLMRVGAQVDNHGAIYVGKNRILQHLINRLSSYDVYGGYWQKVTTAVLRHEALS